jgi:SAM-dependent methyltransferase
MLEIDRIQSRYSERDGSDQYAALWSLLNPSSLHIHQERERKVLYFLKREKSNLSNLRVLDLGCGAGRELLNSVRWGCDIENVVGVEITPHRAAIAFRNLGGRAIIGNAAKLPFANGSFDLVLQYVVFSSVIDADMRKHIADEVLRVLSPNGLFVWYDINIKVDDPHLCSFSRRDVEDLFPRFVFEWETLSTRIGLLKYIYLYGGEWLANLVDKIGMFRTNLLGFGKKIK